MHFSTLSQVGVPSAFAPSTRMLEGFLVRRDFKKEDENGTVVNPP
jgi:hypothetical protein